jgi:murein DD-endopeptidase MepM/ murein hydrolase activator NlpD
MGMRGKNKVFRVVANSFFARIRVLAGAVLTSFMLIGASPAFANSSASVDIAAPLRAAQAAKQQVSGGEDEQFGKLFRSWQAFEDTGSASLAAVSSISSGFGKARPFGTGVSVPSLVPLAGVQMTSGFGMRTHPVLGGRRSHKGVDLGAPTGTPIHAAADGIVSRADWFSSYGLYVSIEHGGEIQTRYAHMSRLNVAKGQRVRKGDVIGFVGSTGRSTGPHLHYEVRINNQAVNPVPYMTTEIAASGSPVTGHGQGGPE